jgi:hypothetical protein
MIKIASKWCQNELNDTHYHAHVSKCTQVGKDVGGANYTVTGISVTIDGLKIDDRIYLTLYTAHDYILQFTITHTLTYTHTY